MTATTRKAAKLDFDDAVDWLLNSRHTADPDVQDMFWGISDGIITREMVDEDEGAALQIVRAARIR